MKIIEKEWVNEHKGMEWQKIKMIRLIDDEGKLVDGYNEVTDTREIKRRDIVE